MTLPVVLRSINSAICIFLTESEIGGKLCVVEVNVVHITELETAELKRSNCLTSY